MVGILHVIVLAAAVSLSYQQCSDATVSFKTVALSIRTKCSQLTRDECLTIHEAREEKCKCICDEKISGKGGNSGSGNSGSGNSGSGNNGGSNTGSDAGAKTDGGGKKGGSSSDDQACFSADSVVQTTRGPMRMAELVAAKDVQVLSLGPEGLQMSEVRHWVHAQPEVRAEFVKIQTEAGQELSLTPNHLIYRTNCAGGPRVAVLAEKLQAGNCVMVRAATGLQESRVATVGRSEATGIFAPITATGTIVVDDVLASCFTTFENEEVQRLMYDIILGAKDALSFLPAALWNSIFGAQEAAVSVPEVVLAALDLGKYLLY